MPVLPPPRSPASGADRAAGLAGPGGASAWPKHSAPRAPVGWRRPPGAGSCHRAAPRGGGQRGGRGRPSRAERSGAGGLHVDVPAGPSPGRAAGLVQGFLACGGSLCSNPAPHRGGWACWKIKKKKKGFLGNVMLKLLNAYERCGAGAFARCKPYEYVSLRKVSFPLGCQGAGAWGWPLAVVPSRPCGARGRTGLRLTAAKLKSHLALFPKGADGLVFICRSSG